MTQPYITPALYEKYFEKGPMPVVDEWSLSLAMGDQLEAEMENHYSTFIVRPTPNSFFNYVRTLPF